MRNTFYRLALSGLCFITFSISAQNEGTMYFMNSLPQSIYLNPAFVPKYKVSVGIPGSSVFISYSNNGFKYNDIYKKDGDVITADLDKLYSNLKDKNYITQAIQADAFRLSLKVSPRVYLTYNSTVKMYSRQMLPKDLTGIFIKGNAPFIGTTATLAPEAEAMALVEHGIGGAYTINKDLVIGARVKWYKGIVNGSTQTSALNLSVDETNYALTLEGNMDVRTSGIQGLDNLDFDSDYKNYMKNNGLGIDLGATYRFLDRINVSLSITDLGYIKWKNDTYGYSLDPTKAKYTFSGFDLNEVFNGNDDYLSSVGDSLENYFEPEEKTISSYKTSMPTKIYLGGNYEIRRNFTAGIVVYSEIFRGRTAIGTTLGLTKNFGKRFTASGTYTISNNSYNNIGLGTSLNLPPFQLYLVGDNILMAAFGGKELNKFINNTQVFNLRLGLNLVFGWDKGPDKLGGFQPSPGFKAKKKKLGIGN
jgi:hypothetical protein